MELPRIRGDSGSCTDLNPFLNWQNCNFHQNKLKIWKVFRDTVVEFFVIQSDLQKNVQCFFWFLCNEKQHKLTKKDKLYIWGVYVTFPIFTLQLGDGEGGQNL